MKEIDPVGGGGMCWQHPPGSANDWGVQNLGRGCLKSRQAVQKLDMGGVIENWL